MNTNEVLLRNDQEWLQFTNPYQVIRAERLEDVLPSLREIEQLVESNGWHAAGFVSYEAAPAFDPALRVHASPEGSTAFPYVWFGLYPAPRTIELPQPAQPREILNWQPTLDKEAYLLAIAQIKEHIARGQTYQVNYTLRLETPFHGSTWDLFLYLIKNQNNYAAYLDIGTYVICSASPELFFERDGTSITCRPMKGTTQRGRTTREDEERSEWLKTSVKNRAENVMIVDMIRNDLGRIAETGSVCVPELFKTERYPTLWQMTSTVTARTSAPLAEIFTALFPCASITGAPKVSTMQVIAGLENSPRRIYTGSIGYIAPKRKARFNVAIRTLLVERERSKAEYGVGGGIVWDSDGAEEYTEALLKARVLTEQPAAFSLLETMLWTPEHGFFLGKKHVARMLDSAQYFDISVTKQKLEEYLLQISSSFQRSQRIRLLADPTGQLSVESRPFEFEQNLKPLQAHLAKQPVDSHDRFLFHKTTNRAIYQSAREGFEQFDDVLLYNESGELTEFTIGNLVVERNGQLLTPPISCGVLPGTFRAHVVETGQVLERTIPVTQLSQCTRVFRINSIRQWQRVEVR